MSRKKVSISELNLTSIGGRVSYVRLTKGLNQEDFGKKIGISKGNISSFENHKYEPSYRVLVQIIEQYKVDPNWLLTGKSEKHIEGQADGEEGMEQPLNLELDVDLLADIIESVDIVLEKEKIELPLNKKARFIALQYELCTETGKGITSDKIKRHLKLVA